MTYWYVDSASGNDSNDGKSLGTAFATIQHAHDLTVAGDTVYILPGVGYGGGTGGGNILNITRTGTAGNYITYSGYPGQPRPLIKSVHGAQAMFTLYGPLAYITIKNLEFAGCNGTISLQAAWTNASGAGWASTYISGESGIGINSNGASLNTNAATASGTTLHFATNPTSSGILVGDTVWDTTATGAITTGTTVQAIGGGGSAWTATITPAVASAVGSGDSIQFRRAIHHIQVLNCIVHDCPLDGIGLGFVDYATVSGCWVYNNGWWSPYAGSGVSIFAPHDVDTNTSTYKSIISDCVIFGNYNYIAENSFSATMNTNASSSTGTSTLHFATNPASSGVFVNFQVFDTTTAASVTPGTYITAIGGGGSAWTATLSAPLQGTVGSGDAILMAGVTDGEGVIIDDGEGDSFGVNPYLGKILVTNCLIFNNGSEGIQNNKTYNVDITFCTLYLNLTNETRIFRSSTGQLNYNNGGSGSWAGGNCFNNILVSPSDAAILQDGSGGVAVYGYNLGYGGNATSMPGSNNITGQDPLFVAPSITPPNPSFPLTWNGFQLQSGSPAIDAGTASYTRLNNADIFGNVSPWGPAADMGSAESPFSPQGQGSVLTLAQVLSSKLQDSQNPGALTLAVWRQIISSLWDNANNT